MQIRTKLTLQFAMMAGSILFAFSILVYSLSANYRKQEFEERLKEKAINTAKLLIEVKEVDDDLMRIIDSANYSALADIEVVVFDYFKRSKIYTSGVNSGIEFSEQLLSEVINKGEYDFKTGEREAVGLLYTNGLRRFVVIASASDRYGLSKLNNLAIIMIIGLMASIVFTVITGLFFSRQALKPISGVVNRVSSISASSLSKRLDEGNGTDEIARLAITFNEMLDRIEKAFQIQKSFVSNASHELRTPLASITSQIEVALIMDRSSDEYKNVLASLLDDAKGLKILANNLLEIASAEQDISALKIAPVRLDELLLQTQAEINAVNPEYIIEAEINDHLEDDGRELTIEGNENLLKLIFVNLMDNACKFSDGGPVKASLSFLKNNVTISISDHGIGIDKEDLVLVFDPFYRAKNAVNHKGHGIGLSLIQKIVKLHKGQIRIDSQPGRGTTVQVTLPYTL
ncbi:MAG: HAMP domain-containing histidine kinase [Lentimicrobium sp.]|nr:HAMP domain-containing histidine kinase [Lentimicrobium sp.]